VATTKEKKTKAAEYLELPYRIVLVRDQWDDGTEGWFAHVDELPGCMSQGRTPDEAIASVRDAMEGWISVALEDGREVPRPRGENEHSGRFIVRAPRSLHAELVRRAREEGTSLNQLAVAALAGAVGWGAPLGPAALDERAVVRLMKLLQQKTEKKRSAR
jgi:antitoxin HicB